MPFSKGMLLGSTPLDNHHPQPTWEGGHNCDGAPPSTGLLHDFTVIAVAIMCS